MTVDRLCDLRARKDYGSDLLARCAGRADGRHEPSAADRSRRPAPGRYGADQVVDAVLHYINEHYSESLTLDQLAEQFFISKYHLLRKFDAQVGTTVHRYILQKR